ncbi:unnamed protein product [Trichogramma brassicae]|uniref:Uncharacterized protein n=1 Tax=Trichogramma brassicae TaxID=86971 RepID=A0A6H5IS11_9HYME|nr:unnamed protein product [Trichogramma brassicae]
MMAVIAAPGICVYAVANVSIYYVWDFIPLGIRENEPTAAAANEFQLARARRQSESYLYLYYYYLVDVLLLRTKPPEREDIVTNAFRPIQRVRCCHVAARESIGHGRIVSRATRTKINGTLISIYDRNLIATFLIKTALLRGGGCACVARAKIYARCTLLYSISMQIARNQEPKCRCAERETSLRQIVALIELNIWMLPVFAVHKKFLWCTSACLCDYIIHHNHCRFFLSFCNNELL